MTTPTHICAGYLISQYVYSIGLISPDMLPAVTTVSIIAANAPDFDIVAIRKILNHRKSLLHVPFYWFSAFAIAGLIIRVSGNKIAATYLLIAGINVLLHFLMDSMAIGHGIRWLAPFIQKEFGIIFGKPAENARAFVANVFRYPLIAGEALLWMTAYLVRQGVWHV